MVEIPVPENFYDIFNYTFQPFTNLFQPFDQLFFVIVLVSINLGVYMKTQSLGATLVSSIFSFVFLSLLIGSQFGWIFYFIAGTVFAFLLYWLIKGR